MIVYLHGFNSAPVSRKAQQLAEFLQAQGLGAEFRCPALPPHARAAAALIAAACADVPGDRLTFVGSSLGGYYATHFAERLDARAVLLNPAIRPYEGLAGALGPQQNLYTGERYQLTQDDLDGWRALEAGRIDPERYLVLLETGDEVLDWRRAARRYEGARMCVRDGGDHSLQSFSEHLPRILAFAGLAPDPGRSAR